MSIVSEEKLSNSSFGKLESRRPKIGSVVAQAGERKSPIKNLSRMVQTVYFDLPRMTRGVPT